MEQSSTTDTTPAERWCLPSEPVVAFAQIDLRSKREVKMDPHHERLEGANIWAAERINGSTAQVTHSCACFLLLGGKQAPPLPRVVLRQQLHKPSCD